MSAARHPLWGKLDRLQMDLRAAQASLTEARSLLSRLDLPDGQSVECPDCGLTWGGPRTLSEHRYHSHNGPEPAHWLEAERLAAVDSG